MSRAYPIGPFELPAHTTPADREAWIRDIEQLPALLRQACEELPPGGLDRPYREGGWTARQVIHHIADGHINCYVRFRLALTEEKPTIKAYNEGAWANLADARDANAEVSLQLIEALHARWAVLMRSLTEDQWSLQFVHPELGERNLAVTLALYAWHGRHHVAHLALITGQGGD